MTLLLLMVEEAIVSVTAGLWIKAAPPPKPLAVLFCDRRGVKSGSGDDLELANMQPV